MVSFSRYFTVHYLSAAPRIFLEFLYHTHLSFQFKGWNLLRQDTKVCFYRGRHKEFKDFFSQEYCVF